MSVNNQASKKVAIGSVLLMLICFATIPSGITTTALTIKSKESARIAVIKPTFTAAAYQSGGFYNYYLGNCSTKCLTVHLVPDGQLDHIHNNYHKLHSHKHATKGAALMNYAASTTGLKVLETLGFKNRTPVDVITDEQLTENPSILNGYDKIVLLHNEYVSQIEFDAITNHKVLYLYPNALYALVFYNPQNRTITLLKGHGYGGINNAFGWGPSMSTKDEYDTKCQNLHFTKVENGEVINCYPELAIRHDKHLLNEIKSRLFSVLSNLRLMPDSMR